MTKWVLPKTTDPFDPVDRPEHYNQSGLKESTLVFRQVNSRV